MISWIGENFLDVHLDAFGKTWHSEHSPCHAYGVQVCVCVCVLQKCSKDFATKC